MPWEVTGKHKVGASQGVWGRVGVRLTQSGVRGLTRQPGGLGGGHCTPGCRLELVALALPAWVLPCPQLWPQGWLGWARGPGSGCCPRPDALYKCKFRRGRLLVEGAIRAALSVQFFTLASLFSIPPGPRPGRGR